MFDPWVEETPWRRAWQPTPVFMPGESPWTEEPGRLQSMESQESDMTEATDHTLLSTYAGELIFALTHCAKSSCFAIRPNHPQQKVQDRTLGHLAPVSSLPPSHSGLLTHSFCLLGPSDGGWSSLLGAGTRRGVGSSKSVCGLSTSCAPSWRLYRGRRALLTLLSLGEPSLRAAYRAPGGSAHPEGSRTAPGKSPKLTNKLA